VQTTAAGAPREPNVRTAREKPFLATGSRTALDWFCTAARANVRAVRRPLCPIRWDVDKNAG